MTGSWVKAAMTPAGYMAKRVSKKPECLKAAQVIDIYSVSGCISEDFADYIRFWMHNGFWLFDSPEIIRSVARENSIGLEGTSLFYYEVYEKEFDGQVWGPYEIEKSRPAKVELPARKQLQGFDVVTFSARTSAECSPLSCNDLAEGLCSNVHCLFSSFEEAESQVTNGMFRNSEPGPYRIFSVYSVEWP